MRCLHLCARSIAVILVAVVATATALFANEQAVSNSVSVADQNAIRAIAATLAPAPDRADTVLNSVKFAEMAQTIRGFADWPALRKIETAYLSAVAAGGAAEGEKFLGAVSRVVAEEHSNAIRHERALKPYFSETHAASAVERGGIRYAPIPLAPPPPSNPATGEAILAIERYVERVPGGMQSAIQVCCGHTPARVYDILRTSPSRTVALLRAVEQGNLPPELRARLLRLIKMVDESSHAVVFERALAPYLKELDLAQARPVPPPTVAPWTAEDEGKVRDIVRGSAKKAGLGDPAASKLVLLMAAAGNDGSTPTALVGPPEPPPDPPGLLPSHNGGPPVPPTPSGPSAASQNLESYSKVQKSVIGSPSPGARITQPLPGSSSGAPRFSFKTLRSSGAGFGGVVFGAPLDITRMAKPTTVTWVIDIPAADGAQGWGHFDVVLTDETVVMTRRLYSDDSYAAWEIVNGRSGVFPALDVAHSEGVGLASDNPSGGAMVVHPALYGLEIGNSAVMADAIGFNMGVEAFKQRFDVAGAAPPVVEKAMAWLTAKKGYYKIIDAPLQVGIRDALVRVERSRGGTYPESLRRVGFLAFQALGVWDDKPLPEAQTPFYEILPALTTAFPAFERLNSFAETFAVMRWAKLSKAAVKPPPPPARSEARLFVFRLPSGDLVQTTHDLSSREETALKLADIRRAADTTVSTLRAAGAPNDALQRIGEVTASLQDKILLKLAMKELWSIYKGQSEDAPQIEAVRTQLYERETKIDDTLEHFSNKEEILVALASPADAATLRNLRNHVETAEDALAESEYALSHAKDEASSLKDRLAALPSGQRQAAEQIYQKLLNAGRDYYNADTDARKRAANIRFNSAQEALEKALPPIDQGKIKVASDLVDERTKDVEKAHTTFDEAVRARMPSWLATSWPAVKNLAALRPW